MKEQKIIVKLARFMQLSCIIGMWFATNGAHLATGRTLGIYGAFAAYGVLNYIEGKWRQ